MDTRPFNQFNQFTSTQGRNRGKTRVKIRNDNPFGGGVPALHNLPAWNKKHLGVTHHGIELTRSEAEIFCSLRFNKSATKTQASTCPSTLLHINQREVAAWLQTEYTNGGENHFRDVKKAEQYAKIANPNHKPKEHKSSKRGFFSWLFHEIFALLNQTRLTMNYGNDIAKIDGKAFMPQINETLKGALGITFRLFGLMYFIRLAYDIVDVLITAFDPEVEPSEMNLSPWTRFKSRVWRAMAQDDRYARMANDAIWGTINAVGYFLIGPLVPIVNLVINVAGFTFDFMIANVMNVFNVNKYDTLQNKLDKVYGTEKAIRLKLAQDHFLTKDNPSKLPYADRVELESRLEMHKSLQEQRRLAIGNAIRLGFTTGVLLIAAVVSLTVPGAVLVAAPIAIALGVANIFAGSTLSGFAYNVGSKLFNIGKAIYNRFKKKDDVVTASPEPQYNQQMKVLRTSSPRVSLDEDHDLVPLLTQSSRRPSGGPKYQPFSPSSTSAVTVAEPTDVLDVVRGALGPSPLDNVITQ